MTLATRTPRRQQADELWAWMPVIRQIVLDRIRTLSAECDDPRELTDAAELLVRIDKKIRIRMPA